MLSDGKDTFESWGTASYDSIGRSVFFWKILSAYAVVTLLSAALIAILLNRFLSAEARSALDGKLETIAELASSMAASNPQGLWSGDLQLRMSEVASDTGTSVDIVLSSGDVMMRSEQGYRLPEDPMSLVEMSAAHRSGKGLASYRLGTGVEFVYAVEPILVQSDKIGYVRVGSDTQELVVQERSVYGKVALGAGGASLLSLLIGAFLAKSVTRPLREIEKACQRISDGDLGLRIEMVRKDEFGVVARSVNRMADSIEDQMRQLRRQRNRLELLLKLLRDSVLVVDEAGRVVFMNRAGERFFDWEWDDDERKNYRDIINVDVVGDLIQESQESGEEIVREVSWRRDAERVYASVYIAPLRLDDHNLSGLIMVVRDVSEGRRFEALRRDFSSNVSHELKTPVTSIAALVDALADGADADEKSRGEFLQRISVQNQRLLRLIEELLTISRLEAGKEVLDLKLVDVREILELVQDTFNTMASVRGVEFETSCHAKETLIKVDERALEVVLNSLVDNAFKFTKKGDKISLAVESDENEIRISVLDTGIGIAPHHLERIFERFYRIDRSRSRGGGGSGLGLAIVKHLTAAHGGQVSVESALEKGSVFTLTFPLAEVTAKLGAR
ncbi:MAG: ATP-binding protein [Verrucomicrobiota bacterium]